MAFIVGGIIGGFWMLGKILKSEIEENTYILPSAPPTHQKANKYISGSIKDSFFYHGDSILRLNNVRISNIHVHNPEKKKVSGKIVIACGGKEIFNEKMKYQWVNTNGVLLHNATIKIETKDKIPLEYTIYYMDIVVHQDNVFAH